MDALVTFTLAMTLVLGFATAWRGVRQRFPAARLGALHGVVGTVALALLGYRIYLGPQNLWFNSAFFLFLLAFIGGLFQLLVRRRDEPPFMGLIILHSVMAVIAFLVLLGGLSG